MLTSRRGRKFLETDALEVTRLKVGYLQRCSDLTFQIEACDATSPVEMRLLVDSIKKPLGGCFLMTLVLSDSSYARQTEDSIRRVVDTKWNSLKTLEAITPIHTLDFCVSFSSVCALFGNHGQSNYAMANTVVDGHLGRHKNAFSVSVPSISGLGYVARNKVEQQNYLKSMIISPDGKPFHSRLKSPTQLGQQTFVLTLRTACSSSTAGFAHLTTFLNCPGIACKRILV
jgi:hypothetical protein